MGHQWGQQKKRSTVDVGGDALVVCTDAARVRIGVVRGDVLCRQTPGPLSYRDWN
jgi:hypothetical protein